MLDDHRNKQAQEKYPICMMRTADIEAAHTSKRTGFRFPKMCSFPIPGSRISKLSIRKAMRYDRTIGLGQSESSTADCTGSPDPKPHQQCRDPRGPSEKSDRVVQPSCSASRSSRIVRMADRSIGSICRTAREFCSDNRTNQDLAALPTFMLKASNIHEAYSFVRSSGVTIVRDVQFDHYFIVEDPEGNAVMICL